MVRMLRAADACYASEVPTSAGFEVFVDDTGFAVLVVSSVALTDRVLPDRAPV